MESFEHTLSRQQPGQLKGLAQMAEGNDLKQVDSEEDLKSNSDDMMDY